MSKKFRYLLIVLGFSFFLVVAPLIIIFVRGVKYDFKEKKFVSTGILALKTEPKELEVFLDGKHKKDSSGEIRFLLPKNYLVTLKKEGYFSWQKRMDVQPGKVVWVSPENSKIYLLKQNLSPEFLQNGVLDFEIWPEGMLILTEKELLTVNVSNFQKAESLPLTNKFSNIHSSANHKYFLLTKTEPNSTTSPVFWFDLVEKKLVDLRELMSMPLSYSNIGPDGTVYALIKNSLYLINVQNLTRQLLLPQIASFQIRGDMLYYLAIQKNSLALFAQDLQSNKTLNLLSNLPNYQKAYLIVNSQKRIFIVSGQEIFSVGDGKLEKLTENLQNWSVEDENITYLASGELWYVNEEGKKNFITRSSEDLEQLKVNQTLGYASYVKNNKIYALELDRRDQQNVYELYSGKNIQKFILDNDSKTLLILDEGELKLLKIQ